MLQVRVFIGGKSNPQATALCGAKVLLLKKFGARLDFDEVDIDMARSWRWNEEDVIRWLGLGDIPIIMCHMHQGAADIWSPCILEDALHSFEKYNGFPNGKHWQCPIFLQDKIRYIHAVPEICNPTLRIFISWDYEYTKYRDLIVGFLRNNDEGNGWVVKLPYVTNTRPRVCQSVDDILAEIVAVHTKTFAEEVIDIPYVMIQVRMENNFEYKVVCWNMVPQYISKRKHGYGKPFAKGQSGTDAILAFAGYAAQLLHQRCPEAIVDGLLRVDIFCTSAARGSRFVVNEFESLEADFFSANGVDEANMRQKMVHYWFNVIAEQVHVIDMANIEAAEAK